MLTREEAIDQMNTWGERRIPFLFFTDFQGNQVFAKRVVELGPEEISYDFNGVSNRNQGSSNVAQLMKTPIRVESFELAFSKVVGEIKYGNSFLTNLTFETPISLSGSLLDVFDTSKARYKLCYRDDFVCFSPEIFVKIENDQMKSFPMKGTIDATRENAEEIILNDPKEMAEHVTIVDLIRNDLSRVASNVKVDRFRFIDTLVTEKGALLQVSSEIIGDLPSNWRSRIGDLLFSMLPAGSICGAPKPKTVEIIKSAETHHRGYYTGVCGIFNGDSFDSGVMIRFIEKRDEHFYYKSGGGITAFSELEKEYQEYIDKIYIPVG